MENFQIKPSSFVLGLAGISGAKGGFSYGPVKDSTATDLILGAYNLGIDCFDTAPVYGFGHSEEFLGSILSSQLKNNREQLSIMTKGGVSWNDKHRIFHSNDPKLIESMFYSSLKRLKLEYIDVYWVHAPDRQVDTRRVVELLEKFKDKGLLKHIGLSNSTFEEYEKSKTVGVIHGIQNECNFFTLSTDFDWVNNLPKDVAFYGYGTLSSGILCPKNLGKKNWNMLDSSDYRSHAKQWNSPAQELLREKKFSFIRENLLNGPMNLILLSLLAPSVIVPGSRAIVGWKSLEQLSSLEELIKSTPELIINAKKFIEGTVMGKKH